MFDYLFISSITFIHSFVQSLNERNKIEFGTTSMIFDQNNKAQISITTLLYPLTITKLQFVNYCKKLNSFIFWDKKKG